MLWRRIFWTRICDFVIHNFLENYGGYGRVDGIRKGPLEKLWGGGGEFLSRRNFFRYQIPCMNFC